MSNGTQEVNVVFPSPSNSNVLCQSIATPVPHATLSMLVEAQGTIWGRNSTTPIGYVLHVWKFCALS